MSHVEIIAEAGCNHNGKLDLALRLADAAKAAGADTFKIQNSVPELETTAVSPVPAYAGQWANQRDMIREIILPFPDTVKLARYCDAIGMAFLSTPADPVSLRFLVDECGIRRIKLGSDNLTNPQMLREAALTKLPVILSTGMATIMEIGAALGLLADTAVYCLMQCTSSYPCPLESANVAAIRTLRETFRMHVGFSDHTEGNLASLIAVGAGAMMVEKHLTLDRWMAGPDHAMSMMPPSFRNYCSAIRQASVACGNGVKEPTEDERANALVVRKSLVAARPIAAGEEFCADNIAVKRPGTGRTPWDYFTLIGKPARRAFAADEMID